MTVNVRQENTVKYEQRVAEPIMPLVNKRIETDALELESRYVSCGGR